MSFGPAVCKADGETVRSAVRGGAKKTGATKIYVAGINVWQKGLDSRGIMYPGDENFSLSQNHLFVCFQNISGSCFSGVNNGLFSFILILVFTIRWYFYKSNSHLINQDNT